MRKFGASLVLLVLALSGCGSGVSTIYDSISPSATQALDAGQSVTLNATVYHDTGSSGVTWSVQGAGTLSNTTATSTVYTAPASVTTASTAAVVAVPVDNKLFSAATQIALAPALTIVSTGTLQQATIGTLYSAQIVATGGSGTLTYTLSGGTLPAGLTLSSTGVISGTPTTAGSSTFTVSVTDMATTPVTVSRPLTLNVAATTLSVSTAAVSNGVSGKAYSVQLAASGGVAPYTWSLGSGGTGLPAGLTLSSSGLLSGTPAASGIYSFTADVTDTEANPQTASKQFTLNIYTPLSITTPSGALAGGSLKNSYSTTLAASGGTTPLTWSIASGSLPAGLTLSSSTGVISGTPTAAGTSNFTVQVADSSQPQQTATAAYSIAVVTSTLAIATTSLPQGTESVAYNATLTSSGGNPPVSWSLAAGSALPAGLTLSSAGVISGTPSAAGTTSFTVQATDSTPYTVSQALSITVVALQSLSVSTTSVPAANIGSVYSTTLAATGGATPYTWTVSSGALPQGITLSSAGVLSGTPVAAGSYTFTAEVTDSEPTPATASRSLTLTVGTTLAPAGSESLLNGNYAFLLQGFENGNAAGTVSGFVALGSLSMNGSGTLTGIEDINTPAGVQTAVSVTGAYSLGADGRGLLTLTAGTTINVYAIAAAEVSGGVAQFVGITEFDNSTGASGTANASGYAKMQSTSAFTAASIDGTYAFGFSGESPCSSCASSVKLGPLAAVGAFTANGVSGISAGSEDAGAYGTTYSGITFTGSFTAPSPGNGRGTMQFAATGTEFSASPVDYSYVVVNADELLMMSNDSHATTSLLAGDVRLQTVTSYTAATLTGNFVGYDSQASGGDGSTALPTATNVTLSRLAITGSGTASLTADADNAGTFTSTAATAVTYTTAADGRTVISVGGAASQILYPYTANAGFALDEAGASSYPALVTYEHQVASTSLPTLLSGNYAAYTLASAAPAADTSGIYVFALNTGGVDGMISGMLNTTLDSSAPSGTLSLDATTSDLFTEASTGRIGVDSATSSSVTSVIYPITSTRAVAIPTASTTEPTVTVLQQ